MTLSAVLCLDKDAALAREQLEKDLQLARSQLEQQIQENRRIISRSSNDLAGGHTPEDPETEVGGEDLCRIKKKVVGGGGGGGGGILLFSIKVTLLILMWH